MFNRDWGADKLALRLEAGSPNALDVDVGDDGTVDFSFDRGTFTAINVQAGAGDDVMRINTLAGNDTVSVASGVSGVIQPIIDLGADE